MSSGRPLIASLAALAAACGGGKPVAGILGPTGPNVVPLTVNGSTCGGTTAYANKPCVSVTVCQPGTSTCATVDGVILDTGSYGLRIFKQALPFAPATGTLAECIQYMDGTSHWGPVATADVVLGGEPAVTIPIQVIDSTFGSVPASCSNPETSPTYYQGILGVGPFAEDCGAYCASYVANGIYFTCSGTTCTGTTVPRSSQVPNPVARLPVDDNGVVVDLPAVQLGGAGSATGSLILGIDTRSNNASAGKTVYLGDQYGEIRTTFAGSTTSSFLDTGSNGLFFEPGNSGLTTCSGNLSSWYCPPSTTSFPAVNYGYSGSGSGTVSFWIGNASSLFSPTSRNAVFSELGGTMPSGTALFDFGLPFFLGRSVYVGVEGKTSLLGAGPYYAY